MCAHASLEGLKAQICTSQEILQPELSAERDYAADAVRGAMCAE